MNTSKLRIITSRKVNYFRFCIIGICIFWILLFAILPQFGMGIITFLERGTVNFIEPEFTISNYLRLFDPNFVKILLDTIKLSAAGTLLCLIIGYPFANAMAQASPKLKPWLLLLVIIPFWTNSLIRTYALIIILKSGGIISMLLQALHITNAPISFMYGDLAVFIGIIYTFLPFMILPLFSSIEKVDKRLYEAARDLGANGIQTFWHITLPLVMPGILAGVMLVFLPSLGAFYIPEILGGSKVMFIGNFIKNQFLTARDWPLGASASIILTLLMFLLLGVHIFVSRRAGQTSQNDFGGGSVLR